MREGLRIRLVLPGRSTEEFLVIGRRLGHRGAGRVVETERERKKAASSILAIFPSQEHVDKSVRPSGF